MYILLTGSPPFAGQNVSETVRLVKRGKYSLSRPELRKVSSQGISLLKSMLCYDPEKRFSAEQCFNHPWFATLKAQNRKTRLDPQTLLNFKTFHVKPKKLKKN